jgi:hypothetical protein
MHPKQEQKVLFHPLLWINIRCCVEQMDDDGGGSVGSFSSV